MVGADFFIGFFLTDVVNRFNLFNCCVMQQSQKQLKQRNRSDRRRRLLLAAAVAALPVFVIGSADAQAVDNSSPAILQDFENTYGTIENRMADVFAAGYGGIYTPPPGRADSGNQSVGYDVY